MRRKIVAGNWKMNMEYVDGMALAGEVAAAVSGGISTHSGVMPEVILAPPFYLLKEISDLTAGIAGLSVAAQNASAYVSGPYTGEVSASMIRSAGALWAIIGHSERRTIFGEDDEILRQKAGQVLNAGLGMIFCVGEVLQERMDNIHFEVVERQLKAGIFHFDGINFRKIVVAYEPVWAIGTGHNATPDQAQEMHDFIRRIIGKHYGNGVADETPVIYGGSCKPSNAGELFSMPDVDGGLIGGASLIASAFVEIIASA